MFNPFSMFEDKTVVSVETVKEAVDNKSAAIIDVRQPEEYATGHIQGSTLIPLPTLLHNVGKLPAKSKTIYVYCRSGSRSGQAVRMLTQMGYTDVHNMSGGLLSWHYPLVR